jgi:retinol dehydrogenase-12
LISVVDTNTYLITGATDGIGKATALALAKQQARLIIHGRDPAKTAAVLQELQAAAPDAELHMLLADFASLEQVAALATKVVQEFPDLNVLINNAGLLTDHRQTSKDGYELTFAVNYLAPVLLTQLLAPLLKRNAPARIINVASTAFGGGYIDFADLQIENNFSGWQAYANSKLANILFSFQLAAELDGSGVVTNSLCPGLIDTNFFHTNTVFTQEAYQRMQPGMRTPEEGALVPLFLATDPTAATISGDFYIREGRDGRRSMPVHPDPELAANLRNHSLGLLKPWLAAV